MNPRLLTPSQRALRQLLRHARPFRRRVELAELDARWLAEAIRAAEPQPARIRFRPDVDGAWALETVRGTPFAGECMRKAGIAENSTAAEVIRITLSRFAYAIGWLREHEVEVVAYVDGAEVTFACDAMLSGGLPLEGIAA